MTAPAEPPTAPPRATRPLPSRSGPDAEAGASAGWDPLRVADVAIAARGLPFRPHVRFTAPVGGVAKSSAVTRHSCFGQNARLLGGLQFGPLRRLPLLRSCIQLLLGLRHIGLRNVEALLCAVTAGIRTCAWCRTLLRVRTVDSPCISGAWDDPAKQHPCRQYRSGQETYRASVLTHGAHCRTGLVALHPPFVAQRGPKVPSHPARSANSARPLSIPAASSSTSGTRS